MPTTAVRVLLFHLPPLVCDMLAAALAGEPGVEVVKEVPELRGLEDFARASDIDAIVCPSDGGALPDECRALLDRSERLRILAVRVNDGTGTLHRLLPHTAALEALAPAGVVAALRMQPAEGAP